MAMEEITHFTHPNHTLSPITSINGNYTCDGCKETGSGKRFSCGTCSFNLHDYCARAPTTLSSFMDPHRLGLTVYDQRMHCHICSEPIDGMSYSCRACNFDAHPGCTSYPQYIDFIAAEAIHHLKLQKDPTPRECNICHRTCTDMWYSCRACNVDVHVRCIAGGGGNGNGGENDVENGGGNGGGDGGGNGGGGGDGNGGSGGNDGGGGGGGGNDRNRFIKLFLKTTYNITAIGVSITTGISLPYIP